MINLHVVGGMEVEEEGMREKVKKGGWGSEEGERRERRNSKVTTYT